MVRIAKFTLLAAGALVVVACSRTEPTPPPPTATPAAAEAGAGSEVTATASSEVTSSTESAITASAESAVTTITESAVTDTTGSAVTTTTESTVTGTAESGITATQVITFVPTTIPTATESGSCFTNAIGLGRADAWRCTTEDNQIHDPCFQVDDTPTLVCDADPVTGAEGFVLELTAPLPAVDTGSMSEPWMIQLEGGTVCGLMTGTIPGGADWLAPYGCQDQSYLLDQFDTANPVWLAQQVTVEVGDSGPMTTTQVTAPIATVGR
jgi:hypothetical protein